MANNPTQLTILQDEIRRRYDTLSKRLKQVARYILDNSNSVAFDTVASIAQQADVPPSTLIRFANAFGFSGFNEMKQMFKQHLMEETANYTERARLFRQTTSDESSPPETPTEILNMFTMVNNQALQQLAMQTSSDDLERAVALLGEAENIYVIGLRRSFSVASYLTYALRHLDRKAFLIDGLGGMFTEQLSLVGPKDVVVAVSFSPFTPGKWSSWWSWARSAKRGRSPLPTARSARWRPSAMSALWCVKRRWMASARRLLPCVWPRRWRFRWR